jgi:tRNA(Arg) A34 adenosine deaminase TadA
MIKKGLIILSLLIISFNSAFANIYSNEKINKEKVESAYKIMIELQNDTKEFIKEGYGPFVAAIYDNEGNLIAKMPNSVIQTNCSNNHAEINAIREAEKILGTYDLAQHNLRLYVTSEPCTMCIGAIMWSGIKEVYYGVPSEKVKKITGFDDGNNQNWQQEFKKRGIIVYGNIASKLGEKVIREYVKSDRIIYKPSR